MIDIPDDISEVEIDLWDPLNRQHPTAQGIVGMYTSIPEWDGGQYWYDLTGLNAGTLTNMGNSNNGWRSESPGGYGSLLFDGSAGYVNLGAPPALEIYGNFSVFCSIKTTQSGVTSFIVAKDFSTGARGWAMGLAGSHLYVEYNGAIVENSTPGSPTLNDGIWHRIGMVVGSGGTTLRVYVDGADNWEATWTGLTPLTPNPLAQTWVGGRSYVSFFQPFAGKITDLIFWNRTLSDADVKAEYDLSVTRYTGMLNRPTNPMSLVNAGAVVPFIFSQNVIPFQTKFGPVGY